MHILYKDALHKTHVSQNPISPTKPQHNTHSVGTYLFPPKPNPRKSNPLLDALECRRKLEGSFGLTPWEAHVVIREGVL